jgi:transcriptional regulator with XRE-family HTH domain
MPVFQGLGKALRWLREKRGLRQYEAAERAAITKAMLSAYETGKQNPSLDTLEKILGALDVGLADLARALDLVNERGPRPRSVPAPAAPLLDVRALLGVEVLEREEEEALAQMLGGFHRLIRYLHSTGSG